jgi:subtilisin family serine protease
MLFCFRSGLFFASTPANGADVISVGSVNSIATPLFARQGQFAVGSEPNATFSYYPANNPFPGNISGYPLYALSFNASNPADACTELPSNTTTLSGNIVLIRRGGCPFVTKIANVQKFGAEYVIFYNNENPITNPQSVTGVLAAMVSAEQGAQWVMFLEEGQTINFYFPENSTTGVIYWPNNVTGGTMSTFSSWSPTNELYIKPEVSAPGGNILSTYPINLGSYAVLSGTSMAAPYIAGVVALYKSVNDSQTILDYRTLRQILSTTATPLPFNNGSQTYPYLAPVVQQGGGLVNAYAVVHYTTMISPSTLALNDTANFNQTVEFTIANTDSTAVSYTLTHVSLFPSNSLILLIYRFYTARSSHSICFRREFYFSSKFSSRSQRTICHS